MVDDTLPDDIHSDTMDAEEGLRVRAVHSSRRGLHRRSLPRGGLGRPEHRAGIVGDDVRPLALVTGASSGIGKEIARCLANGGYDVALVARREELLRELADELVTEHGCRADVIVADLSDASQVDTVKQMVEEANVLVNNAGFGKWGMLTDQDEGSVEEMVDVNIRALTTLTRHYAGKMMVRGGGRILNVASIAAFQPGPGMAAYCATKSYVLSFSRSLHSELKGSGVTVTCLCPGYVETGFGEVAGMNLRGEIKTWSAIPASRVASIGVRAMERGRREVIPGLLNKPVPFFGRVLPVSFQLAIVRVVLMLGRPSR